MYIVTEEGSTAMWHGHANQLRVRSIILPSTVMSRAGSNSNTTTETAAPPVLRRSTRIRRPRIPWSLSN